MFDMLSNQSMSDRVEQGRKLEAQIAKNWAPQLAAIGCKVLDVTSNEDKYDKIDRWIVTAKGTKLSVQIKGRIESGDDLIYEIVKNMETGEIGRDLKGKADLYLYVDRSGKGWLYKNATIHAAVKVLLDQVMKDLVKNERQTEWDGPTYELKITTDNYHGNTKLMGFFAPNHFPVISTFKNLYA